MKLSTKGRYAVTALADIALADPLRPVSLAEISARQDISLPYLEQLFLKLRKATLVHSVRGPGGGYRLSRPPEAITIADVMYAVDETLRASKCTGVVGEGCARRREDCLTHDLWEQLSAQVHVYLQSVSIADVVKRRLNPCPAVPDFMSLVK